MVLNIFNQAISYNLLIFNELLAFRILSNISTTAVFNFFPSEVLLNPTKFILLPFNTIYNEKWSQKHKHSLYPLEVETIKISYEYISLTIYLHDFYIFFALSCHIQYLYYVHYVQSMYISSNNTLFTSKLDQHNS